MYLFTPHSLIPSFHMYITLCQVFTEDAKRKETVHDFDKSNGKDKHINREKPYGRRKFHGSASFNKEDGFLFSSFLTEIKVIQKT